MLELLGSRLGISFITIIFTIALSIFLIKKYHLSKYQVFVFILLVLFWSSIIIVREYRKAYAIASLDIGGLGLDLVLASEMAAAYGLISIFVRLPIFAFSDFFKSRKFMIALALTFIMGSSIMVGINPNYESLYVSSLALGIGASMLSLFNVLFSETFTLQQALMSVSILSVAPLLAEFLTSPLQYFVTSQAIKNYNFMWWMSAALAGVALVFLMFIKDNKEKIRVFTISKFKQILSDKRFLVLCLLGVVVSFIRFASSNSNSVVYATVIKSSPLMVAYIGTTFSIFQLVAGVLVGIYLKQKIGVKNTMILGLSLTAVYTLVSGFSSNAVLYFILTGLNGFGYGLTYNVLLGMAMQPFKKDLREISMGIYQTFFAIGIFYGDKIYALIKPKETTVADYQGVFIIITWVSLATILFVLLVFNRRNKAFLEG